MFSAKNFVLKSILTLLVFITLAGFSPQKNKNGKKNSANFHNDSIVCDSIIKVAEKHIKKPYCYGSRVPNCFDCSGFVSHVFKQFEVSLPHCSSCQAQLGKFVSFVNATAGDLIFFTGRNKNSETVGHVGIVTEQKDDKIFFIHASVQAGVIVSNTKEDYYASRLMFVKRIHIEP